MENEQTFGGEGRMGDDQTRGWGHYHVTKDGATTFLFSLPPPSPHFNTLSKTLHLAPRTM